MINLGKNMRGPISGESFFRKRADSNWVCGSNYVDAIVVRYFGDGKELKVPGVREVSHIMIEVGSKSMDRDKIHEVIKDGISVGWVFLSQNLMKFQVGGNREAMYGNLGKRG
ncbi:hypothetical protein KKA14_11170 [bacterium]|nr:hypothetical protein [bacterium]